MCRYTHCVKVTEQIQIYRITADLTISDKTYTSVAFANKTVRSSRKP